MPLDSTTLATSLIAEAAPEMLRQLRAISDQAFDEFSDDARVLVDRIDRAERRELLDAATALLDGADLDEGMARLREVVERIKRSDYIEGSD